MQQNFFEVECSREYLFLLKKKKKERKIAFTRMYDKKYAWYDIASKNTECVKIAQMKTETTSRRRETTLPRGAVACRRIAS